MTPRQRLAAVRAFLRDGHSICPWAALSERAGRVLYAAPRPDLLQADLWPTLRRFAGWEGPLVILLPKDLAPEAARPQATSVMLELLLAFERANQPQVPIGRLRAFGDTHVKPMLEGDPGQRLFPQLLRCRGHAAAAARRLCPELDQRDVFSIGAMGPGYQPTSQGKPHPRAAPHSLLWVVSQREMMVAKIEQPHLFSAVRRAMAERIGFLYDGDALVLPQDPAPPEREEPIWWSLQQDLHAAAITKVMAAAGLPVPFLERLRALARAHRGIYELLVLWSEADNQIDRDEAVADLVALAKDIGEPPL